MNSIKATNLIVASMAVLLWSLSSSAISPNALSKKISKNEAVTVIDVRSNALYRQGHIYNAINIPAALIETKQLPPLGSVIVYGDGIDDEAVSRAVIQLNLKPGIDAEALEGGIAAWSAQQAVIGGESGLQQQGSYKLLSYNDLQKLADRNRQVLLVDLRRNVQQESLAEHFPSAEIVDAVTDTADRQRGAASTRERLARIPRGNRRVLVLIDDGDGHADEVARQLHGANVKRLAILVGGEEALRGRGVITEKVIQSGQE